MNPLKPLVKLVHTEEYTTVTFREGEEKFRRIYEKLLDLDKHVRLTLPMGESVDLFHVRAGDYTQVRRHDEIESNPLHEIITRHYEYRFD